MSDFITKLEEVVARNPEQKIHIDYRVNRAKAPLKGIKRSIREEHKKVISMQVITHGRPTIGQPELKGGDIVVIRVMMLAKDHLEYLKRKQAPEYRTGEGDI